MTRAGWVNKGVRAGESILMIQISQNLSRGRDTPVAYLGPAKGDNLPVLRGLEIQKYT